MDVSAQRSFIARLPLLGLLAFSPLATRDHQVSGADEILFDTASVVVCRDVSSESFAQIHPGERLLQADIEISSFHDRATSENLELIVQVYSPSRRIHVADYEPKTMVASELEGTIAVETTSEASASIGVNANGSLEKLAQLTGQATAGGRLVETERYQRLPPSELVLASGIMHRGAGVFYKLRPTPNTTLEGGRLFTILFRVDAAWRGDLLEVSCLARNESPNSINPLEGERRFGGASFVVSCCIEGDPQARVAAERYSRSEFELRQSARLHREAIQNESHSNVFQRVGNRLGLVDSGIPSNWLNRLIHGDLRTYQTYQARLPEDVQDAVTAWIQARQSLQAMRFEAIELTSDSASVPLDSVSVNHPSTSN